MGTRASQLREEEEDDDDPARWEVNGEDATRHGGRGGLASPCGHHRRCFKLKQTHEYNHINQAQ